jgi:hypothetical protein
MIYHNGSDLSVHSQDSEQTKPRAGAPNGANGARFSAFFPLAIAD